MFAVNHFKNVLNIDLTEAEDENISTNPVSTPSSTSTSKSSSEIKPKLRSTLDLDARFFPKGLQAGSIISLQGNEGSGKTFFITYLLARFLHNYPEKYALLIDTACQFNIQNLLSVLCHIDEELQELFRAKPDTDPETLPKLRDYVQRLHLIRCFTPDELLMTIGPLSHRSTVEEMLLENPELSFVAIDPLDSFCYCSALCDLPSSECPDLASLIKKCVQSTKTPIICSFSPGNLNAFLPQASTTRKNTSTIIDDFDRDSSDSDSSIYSDGDDNNEKEENKDSETKPADAQLEQDSLHEEIQNFNQTENPGNSAIAIDSFQNLPRSKAKEKKTKKKYDEPNVFIFQDSFTHILSLKIISQPNPYTENPEAEDKEKLIIEAHLKSNWSRHNPKTALSGDDGENQLARFSIFSGMVYLEDGIPQVK